MGRLQNKFYVVCFVKKLFQLFLSFLYNPLKSWKPCHLFPLDTAPDFIDLMAKFIFSFLLLYTRPDKLLIYLLFKGKGMDFQALQSKTCAIWVKITWILCIIFIIPFPTPVYQHFFRIFTVACTWSRFCCSRLSTAGSALLLPGAETAELALVGEKRWVRHQQLLAPLCGMPHLY